jgi:hypothetical protein
VTALYAVVRSSVAAQIDTLSGWNLIDVPYDQFGFGVVDDVPESTAHLAYAVGVPTSRPARTHDRQRWDEGLLNLSGVVVRFLARVTAKGKLASVDAGMAQEVLMLEAMLRTTFSTTVRIDSWTSTRRSTNPTGEWRLTEVTFDALHIVTN